MRGIKISAVKSSDEDLLNLFAEWYWNEWQIPKETTLARLSAHPNDDILFQLILTKDGIPAVTGDLYLNVGLIKVYPDFKKMGPWVTQVYTDPAFRNQGLGTQLLGAIESKATSMGYKELFLYTNTAEKLYERNLWVTFDRVEYREKGTVVMRKMVGSK